MENGNRDSSYWPFNCIAHVSACSCIRMYGINVCEYYLHNLEVLRESLSHIEPYPNEQSKNKWQTWPQMTPNDPTQTCCVMVRAHVCINSTSDVQTTFIHFIHFYLFWPTLISPIYQINGKWSSDASEWPFIPFIDYLIKN